MNEVEEFIEHFGKKGMHWGIRNRKEVIKAPKKTSLDFRKSQEIRKQRHPQLTNKQINTANTRANLEQNFNRLNPSKVKKGHNQVLAILAAAGLGVSLFNMANSPAGKAAISAGRKFIKK